MSAITAAQYWQPYLRPSSNTRPTTKFLKLDPPPRESSRAARDPMLFAMHEQIDRIADLRDNWDGYGSSQADSLSINNAHQFLEDVYRQIIVDVAQQTPDRVTPGWQAPHISANEDGNIVFEWWNGNRKITVYVGPQQSSYIKSWGPHVVDDMEDGVLSDDGIPLFWGWLFE